MGEWYWKSAKLRSKNKKWSVFPQEKVKSGRLQHSVLGWCWFFMFNVNLKKKCSVISRRGYLTENEIQQDQKQKSSMITVSEQAQL